MPQRECGSYQKKNRNPAAPKETSRQVKRDKRERKKKGLKTIKGGGGLLVRQVEVRCRHRRECGLELTKTGAPWNKIMYHVRHAQHASSFVLPPFVGKILKRFEVIIDYITHPLCLSAARLNCLLAETKRAR